jgi:hypothetical protein
MRYTCSGSPGEWAQSVDKCVSRDGLDLHPLSALHSGFASLISRGKTATRVR